MICNTTILRKEGVLYIKYLGVIGCVDIVLNNDAAMSYF